jgi:hypothetical protein
VVDRSVDPNLRQLLGLRFSSRELVSNKPKQLHHFAESVETTTILQVNQMTADGAYKSSKKSKLSESSLSSPMYIL